MQMVTGYKMSCCKYALVLLLGLTHYTLIAQSGAKADSYKITHSNEKQYYKKAVALLQINNRDSLFKAHQLLTRLHYFDSIVYSAKRLQPLYKKIETINLSNIKKDIIGEWNFEWRGSNWGGTRNNDTIMEKIIFSAHKAFFFHNNKLTRETTYSITNEFSEMLKEFDFQIVFQDDHTMNNIYCKKSGADYNAHLKFSPVHVGLFFAATGFCNDCGYRIYMKKSAQSYRLTP